MSKETTVIEVNGIKLEVDLRTAKRIEELRVGDKVKVLIKEVYGSNFSVHPGVIVGFEPFNALPTIIVAYAIVGYNSFELKFVHFNANTKDHEIIKALDDDVELTKADVMQAFERQIAEHERQVQALREKRDYFIRQFGVYWEQVSKQSQPT